MTLDTGLLAPIVAERMGWPPALTAVGLSAAAMPVVFLAATRPRCSTTRASRRFSPIPS